MSAKIIDGKIIAADLRARVAAEVQKAHEQHAVVEAELRAQLAAITAAASRLSDIGPQVGRQWSNDSNSSQGSIVSASSSRDSRLVL